VHRDFKPDNVLVDAAEHVRVTDFGLARLDADEPLATEMAPGASNVSLTRTGRLGGTLQYMAPEQLSGGRVDARTDLFSFCVSLYEALFGQLPFAGTSPAERLQALQLDMMRAPPSSARVPAKLLRLLRWGLRRDPEARPADMESLLVGLRETLHSRVPSLAAVLIIGALVAGAAIALATRHSAHVAAGPRQTLVMLPLAGATDDAWLGSAAAEVVGAGLHAAGGPSLVPGHDVTRMLRELALPREARLSAEARQRVRDDLHADFAVGGEYRRQRGTSVRLVLRLIDLASGRALAAADEAGDESALAALAVRASVRLRVGLGVRPLTAHDEEAARALLPTQLDAIRAYGRGLNARQLGNNVDAARWLDTATQLAPDHAYAQLTLATTLTDLGETRKAETAAARAFASSHNFEREEQLWFEAFYRERHRDYDRAIELYRALIAMDPNYVDWTLRLSSLQILAQHRRDCGPTLAALRRLPPPDPADPNIDLAEGWCAHEFNDYRLVRASAERAQAEAERRGARLLVARAQFLEGVALAKLGDPDEALHYHRAAQPVFHALGDRAMEARSLTAQGDIFHTRHQLVEALKLAEAALPLYRAEGDIPSELVTLNGIAVAIGSSDPARARALYNEVLAKTRADQDQNVIMLVLANRAALDLTRGEVTTAIEDETASLRLARQYGGQGLKMMDLMNLCSTRARATDTVAALAACDEAAEIELATGNSSRTADIAVDKTLALLASGAWEAAETTARQALQEALRAGDVAVEVTARLELAQAQVRAGRVGAASEAIAAARARVGAAQDPEVAVLLAITAARVQAASAHSPAARAAAANAAGEAATQAHAAGFILHERDARLLQYEIEYSAGHQARVSAPLSELEHEARRAGDLLIARQASVLLHRQR
jgi:tetratricopeptide (TPR) repeat protein